MECPESTARGFSAVVGTLASQPASKRASTRARYMQEPLFRLLVQKSLCLTQQLLLHASSNMLLVML